VSSLGGVADPPCSVNDHSRASDCQSYALTKSAVRPLDHKLLAPARWAAGARTWRHQVLGSLRLFRIATSVKRTCHLAKQRLPLFWHCGLALTPAVKGDMV
jgi:hypothetical protein